MRMLTLALVGVMMLAPAQGFSKTMQKACMKSERNPSRSTCKCIQSVADQRLSQSDQRLASKFFNDPHMSQEIRQSDNRSKEKFWLRYKAFGEVVGRQCG
ncbi:MAG: hypothetical protein AAF429_09235 [Pseudomonadota bacterium]